MNRGTVAPHDRRRGHPCDRPCRGCIYRIVERQRQALGVDRLGVPSRLRQKKLQPLYLGRLGLHLRLGAGQRCQCLRALTRQQQPSQIRAKTLSLRQRLEQRIKFRHIRFQWLRRRGHERRADMMLNLPCLGPAGSVLVQQTTVSGQKLDIQIR